MSEKERTLRVADAIRAEFAWNGRGLLGLTFLRQFHRWGAEHAADGWRFVLSTD